VAQPAHPLTSGRRSPPTARVAAVIDALAVAPADAPLAAVSRRANITASTCLGILNELVDLGWVLRHVPGPTYSLGPTAVAIGRAAQRGHPTLSHARPAIIELAHRIDFVCTLSGVVGDHIVVFDRVDRDGPATPAVAAGTRFPFAAPIGVMYAAWSGDRAVERWLQRALIELDAARVERAREVIRTCRAQGWIADRLTDVDFVLHELLRLIDGGVDGDGLRHALSHSSRIFGYRDYLPHELGEHEELSVSFVTAPTFSVDGELDLVVSAYVMQTAMPVTELERVAGTVRDTADAITRGAGGFDPWRSSTR
jgi:DNA-binding IclR family transcriptional regulator